MKKTILLLLGVMMALSVSADKVGSLGSDMLLIGAHRTLQDVQQSEVLYTYDRPLTATIDEVRIWNATMSGDQLKKQRKVRLTGTEPGLVAYYPFESKTLDGQNQVVTNGSAADLCNSGFDAQLSELGGSSAVIGTYTDTAKVPHRYVAENGNLLEYNNLQQLAKLAEAIGCTPFPQTPDETFLEYISFMEAGCHSAERHFFK